MRGYDEVSFKEREDGAILIFCKESHIGFFTWDHVLKEYYFQADMECDLALYAGHMDVILAKLIELNQVIE